MQESKTHFEQIPVAEVKKIAREIHDRRCRKRQRSQRNFTEQVEASSPGVAREKRKAGLTMQLPESNINCSVCAKPIALETAKTDEVGRAVHDECYLLKVGTGPLPDSVHISKGNTD